MGFLDRAPALPRLGLGVATEYGAHASPGSLDVVRLRREYPAFASFMEVGVETAKGLDSDAKRWAAAGYPTTYHYLDVNLDEPEDLDDAWLDEVRTLIEVLNPAWICGDAGLWHHGPRARGHMLLLPPILSDASASALSDGVCSFRDATGLEVIPENPPGHIFLGDLHLLDFFARGCERGDTGMLLDCAHLAIYQRLHGLDPLTGLDGFPLDRIIELVLLAKEAPSELDLPYPDLAVLDFISEDPRYLDRWSEVLARGHRRVTTMGTDCHRNSFPAKLPDGERIDSYRRMMVWFSNHLLIRPEADGTWDDRHLKEALRSGRLYGAFEVYGYPRGFDFHARCAGSVHEMGAEVQLDDGATLVASVPSVEGLKPHGLQPELTIRLLRATVDGWETITRVSDDLRHEVSQPGAYRVEVRMVPRHLKPYLAARSVAASEEDRVWIYSNPIYVR